MTEVAETYLGNVNSNSELALITSDCLKINLQFSDRYKGRIHTYTNSNLAVGIIKSRDRALQSGDLFKTNSGKFVLIHLQEPRTVSYRFIYPRHECLLLPNWYISVMY